MGLSHQFEALRVAFVEPIQYRSFALWFQRTEQLLHHHTGGRVHYPVRRIIRALKAKVDLPPTDGADIPEEVDKLNRDGYSILPFRVSETHVAEFKKFAFSSPLLRPMTSAHAGHAVGA